MAQAFLAQEGSSVSCLLLPQTPTNPDKLRQTAVKMALAPDQGADDVPVKEHEVYFAMLAEQAERYEEMAAHMRTAVLIEDELNERERTLLAVSYKQAVGARRS